MEYELKVLDLMDVDVESSFPVLARNMGIVTGALARAPRALRKLKVGGPRDDDLFVPSFGLTSMKRRVTAIAALAGLVLAAGAAAATPSPAAYRAQMNAMCRSYTPAMMKAKANLSKAQKANDAHGMGVAIGQLLLLGLAEDAKIESTPVPAAMRAQMAPILSRLKAIDVHARLAITKAAAGDANGMGAELTKIGQLSTGLNKRTDAAGLRDCGSNQS